MEVGEPSEAPNDDSKTVIRSHVMRDFYEKRKQRRRGSGLPELASAFSKAEGASKQTHRFKVGPQGLHEVTRRGRKRKSILPQTEDAHSVGKYDCVNRDFVHDAEFIGLFQHSTPPDMPINSGCSEQPNDTVTGVGQCSFGGTAFTDEETYQSTHLDIDNRNDEPCLLPAIPASLTGGAGGIDPFNTLPLPNSPRTQMLLYHGEHITFYQKPLLVQTSRLGTSRMPTCIS